MDVTFQKFGLQLCTNPYYNLLAPFSHGAVKISYKYGSFVNCYFEPPTEPTDLDKGVKVITAVELQKPLDRLQSSICS